MACEARIAAYAIIERCPEVFDGIETLVDVGGGNGDNFVIKLSCNLFVNFYLACNSKRTKLLLLVLLFEDLGGI